MTFADRVAEFGARAKEKLSGPGEREALLSQPVSQFIENIGRDMGMATVTHDQVSELDGAVKPDFGIRVNGVFQGWIETKAPGVSLDPSTYGKSTHNFRQWQRLRELPNLLHTNGIEWRYWRYGELVDEPVSMHTPDLERTRGNLTAPSRLELLIRSFLQWDPPPITSVGKLVETLAPLARLLREEVRLALKAERRAIRAGGDPMRQPFLGISKDWRALLFPQATDDEFSDGFAQTVVFALLLAVSDGIEISVNTLHDVAVRLEGHYTLMGRALDLLTEHVRHTPTWSAIEIIARVIAAVRWESMAARGDDLYLHLYEHFLGTYDPEMRKKSGSYYTPVEIVDSMVRLADEALKTYLGKNEGLRHPNVTIIDPGMGTGTYPLSILRKVSDAAARQYGPGAGSEAVANAAARLYGIEIQSGPFSVAELRISAAMRAVGAALPPDGLNLYVADTLEDPYSASNTQLSYTLQLIAQQRQKANAIKREKNIQVCIGNPPYKDHAGGMGGWIETGIDPATNRPPLEAFKLPGNGLHERHLSNLYIYFWRFGTWKVFESTNRPELLDGGQGLVCFITATGYLSGPGFRGMREYLRRTCSNGWIINLTPEGKQPPPQNAVFNIETPVAIALFARSANVKPDVPAHIRYIDLHGTKAEKFAALANLTLENGEWRDVRSGWNDVFVAPGLTAEWDEFPALDDLMPWRANGVLAGRGWVYGPSRDILEARLHDLVSEPDPAVKSAKFGEGRDASLTARKTPLPGDDVEKETLVPFKDVVMVTEPKIVRVGYRAFDRQWLIADKRLLIQPSPTLWQGRIPDQLYVVELHSEYPRSGPAVAFSSLIPDVHFFRGSGGGRALPMLHPDGSANVAPGLMKLLSMHYGHRIPDTDLVAYIAGVCSHPGFVRRFDEELHTPGVRVPLTKDYTLWIQAVVLGRHVIWLHTYGDIGSHPDGLVGVRDAREAMSLPDCEIAVGTSMPSETSYDPETCELKLGAGMWSKVTPEVRGYTVGGTNVIDSWIGYRLEHPKGRRPSPLDKVNVTAWPNDWSVEFTNLLSVLTQLVELEQAQDELLTEILAGDAFTYAGLQEAGVSWPAKIGDAGRAPRMPLAGEGLYSPSADE